MTGKINYYIGTIVATAREGHELLKNKPELQEIIVDIPGVIQGVLAYPIAGMNDEPRVGESVIVIGMDPVYNSYYVYQKLKENDFIGLRASGKMIDVTPDNITIGVYDENDQYTGDQRPDCSKLASITISKEGAITVHAKEGEITVHAEKDINIKADANVNINVSGNATVTAGILETTGGTWKTGNGVASATGDGPFCGIPFCAFSGAPQCGKQC